MKERESIRKISKRMSYWLRHRPDVGGLTLQDGGWVVVSELLDALNRKGHRLEFSDLEFVVVNNDKKRFEFDEEKLRIRARQGHSVDVDLGYENVQPPSVLYHGTATRSVDSILEEGLTKQKRHHVHLSVDKELMIEVGNRHGHPILLKIDSAKMAEDQFSFFHTENDVWLTDFVPPEYIEVCEVSRV